MKDSRTIISHLKKNPLFNKLDQEECYKMLMELLPQSLARFIKFIYSKNDKLFFVLNHPAGKMELDYKIDLIKSLLKKIASFNPNCCETSQKQIVLFVSNKKEPVQKEEKTTMIYYTEQANGTFKNVAQDSELYEVFEKVRREIECLKQR